jgi:hypothetical protein
MCAPSVNLCHRSIQGINWIVSFTIIVSKVVSWFLLPQAKARRPSAMQLRTVEGGNWRLAIGPFTQPVSDRWLMPPYSKLCGALNRWRETVYDEKRHSEAKIALFHHRVPTRVCVGWWSCLFVEFTYSRPFPHFVLILVRRIYALRLGSQLHLCVSKWNVQDSNPNSANVFDVLLIGKPLPNSNLARKSRNPRTAALLKRNNWLEFRDSECMESRKVQILLQFNVAFFSFAFSCQPITSVKGVI